MEVTFDERAWHAWLFKYTYDAELPSSGCAYFWGVVLAFALVPVNVALYVTAGPGFALAYVLKWSAEAGLALAGTPKRISNPPRPKGYMSLLCYTMITVYGYLLPPIVLFSTGAFALSPLPLVVLCSIAFWVAITFVSVWLLGLILSTDRNEEPGLFRARAKAWAKGVCPTINWKSNDHPD